MLKAGTKLHGSEGLYSSVSVQYVEGLNWKQIQRKITKEIKEELKAKKCEEAKEKT